MTESRYLKMLLADVALTAAAIVAGFFPSYSAELSAAYKSEPDTWLMSNIWLAAGILGVLVLALLFALIGLIGMFRFKTWARTLSLYSTLIIYVLRPFLGTLLLSGLQDALLDASTLLWGAILAVSYFSPVSARFGR
jgi:hypothetical protein